MHLSCIFLKKVIERLHNFFLFIPIFLYNYVNIRIIIYHSLDREILKIYFLESTASCEVSLSGTTATLVVKAAELPIKLAVVFAEDPPQPSVQWRLLLSADSSQKQRHNLQRLRPELGGAAGRCIS